MMPVSTQIAREEREHRVVEREDDPVRLARVRDGAIEQPDADHREAEPEHAAHDAEADALDEQLADDAPARGAERDPDGDLARTVHRT